MRSPRLTRLRVPPDDGGGSATAMSERKTTTGSGEEVVELEMRGSLGPMAISLGLFSSAGAIVTAIGWREPDHSIPAGLVFVALGLAFGSWVTFHRLSIRGGRLRYSVPLRRTIEVELNQITRLGYEVGDQRYRDRFRPFMRISVVAETPHGTKRFDIALKPFRLEDRHRLHQFLHERGLLAHGVDGSPAPPM